MGLDISRQVKNLKKATKLFKSVIHDKRWKVEFYSMQNNAYYDK